MTNELRYYTGDYLILDLNKVDAVGKYTESDGSFTSIAYLNGTRLEAPTDSLFKQFKEYTGLV